MTSHTELYEKLLEKYRVNAPLPEKSRNEVLARKKKLYKRIMKRKGAYGIVIAIVSHLFFSLRRKGLPVSFFKSALLTAAAAAILTFSAAGGLYSLIKWIKAPGHGIKENEKKVEDGSKSTAYTHEKNVEHTRKALTEQKRISVKNHQTLSGEKHTVRYNPLKAHKSLRKQAALLTGRIIGNLKKQNKNLDIMPAGSKQGGSSGIILIGSLEPLGKSYSVKTKLVDVKSTKVLFMNSYTVPLDDTLDTSAEAIARSISDMLLKLNKREKRD